MPENAFLLPARAAGEQVATADMTAKEALKVFRTEQISAYRKNANELVAAGAPKELVMLNYLPEDLLNCLRKPSAGEITNDDDGRIASQTAAAPLAKRPCQIS